MRKISSWTTRNTPVIGKVYLVLISTLLLHHLTSHKQMADSSIVTAQDQRCLLENLPYLAKFLEPGSSWVYHRTGNASNEAIKHTIKSPLFTNTLDFVFTFHVPVFGQLISHRTVYLLQIESQFRIPFKRQFICVSQQPKTIRPGETVRRADIHREGVCQKYRKSSN